MPSTASILRLAGLYVDGALGDNGRLLPLGSLNELFGRFGLGGWNCSSGNSWRGPGRRIGVS